MNKQEMLNNEYLKSGRELHGGSLEDLHDFVRNVYSAHAPLIELWDGWEKTYKFDFEKSGISAGQIREIFEDSGASLYNPELAKRHLRPRYLSRIWMHDKVQEFGPTNISEFFMTPSQRFDKPTIKLRPGQNVARVIRRVIGRLEADDFFTIDNIYSIRLHWQNFLSVLGEIRAITRTKIEISLSCAPSAFLALGHYGEDDSCYRTNHEYQNSKLVLAGQTDSIVGLVEDEVGICARFWGKLVLNDHDRFLAVTNLYMMNWGKFNPLLHKLARELGIDHKKFSKCLDKELFNNCDDRVFTNASNALIGISEAGFNIYASNACDSLTACLEFVGPNCPRCERSIDSDDLYCCTQCAELVCYECLSGKADSVCMDCIDDYLMDHTQCDRCRRFCLKEDLNECKEEGCQKVYCASCQGIATCLCGRSRIVDGDTSSISNITIYDDPRASRWIVIDPE